MDPGMNGWWSKKYWAHNNLSVHCKILFAFLVYVKIFQNKMLGENWNVNIDWQNTMTHTIYRPCSDFANVPIMFFKKKNKTKQNRNPRSYL